MKKIFLLSILFLTTQIFAISELEKLFLKEAVTPEARKTTKSYFAKRAVDYKELAAKYEAISKQPQGGKAAASAENQKKYKDLADKAQEESAKYQAEADKL
ncbi:hypothetical protein LPTSP3_g14660 [Leptospira kobayashii]|uniref:Uncharacterized protein n=1 Tax=Leptospira kobayashii TaxID=1917830 RepID=A0ABN6KCN4_9LEPT|nr:hypothetical protein [Leptospira kobayashii]BDA78536.1 hypothetical protein LPTSP3_g14660 [Leptospira kobayashii]